MGETVIETESERLHYEVSAREKHSCLLKWRKKKGLMMQRF
jgi:hypothetical protein